MTKLRPDDIEPPELGRLVDLAERPRTQNWSFRAALCRYAQPQPERVSALLDLVRRSDFAIQAHAKCIEHDGPALWHAVATGATGELDAQVVGLLQAMAELDRLGDTLAAWAVDRTGDAPDAAVDAVIEDVGRRLDAIGVPHEERTRPQVMRRPPASPKGA